MSLYISPDIKFGVSFSGRDCERFRRLYWMICLVGHRPLRMWCSLLCIALNKVWSAFGGNGSTDGIGGGILLVLVCLLASLDTLFHLFPRDCLFLCGFILPR